MHSNPSRIVLCAISAAFVLAVGCQKQEPPKKTTPQASAPPAISLEVVREKERSRSFLAVNKHLELGGTLYGYMDVDGDVQKLLTGLQALLGQFGQLQPEVAKYAKTDYVALAATLGLADVKAVGVSSVPDGTGYFRNRIFLHIPGERRGLLASFGGKPAPFALVGLAPADTAFYGEDEMDLGIAYRSIKEVVAKVGGEPAGDQIEVFLKKTGESIALSLIDLIYGLKGRTAIVLRVDEKKTVSITGANPPIQVPAFSLLVAVEGIAPVVEPALAKSKAWRAREEDGAKMYELVPSLPVAGLVPVMARDGSMLLLATSREFLAECRARPGGLAKDPEFQRALDHVGREGNTLSYVSPRFFARVRDIDKLNPGLPPQVQSMLAFVLADVPQITRPLVSIRSNLSDGILVRSYLNRSLKREITMVSVYNPVTVGLIAAMAIPAFQKVRQASQEKAVLNNLRQLAAAADQHYLETGSRTATFDDLVGPTRYVRRINPVAGEDYRQIRFAQGRPLVVRLPDGRVIQYPMANPPPRPPAPAKKKQ
jgi:type IV pilus assembly protein PilA